MNIALDIDGTITEHPEFYVYLTEAWLARGGHVHIITARMHRDHKATANLLMRLGFHKALASGRVTIHYFPCDYHWPFPSDGYAARMKQEHAGWKAHVCNQLGVVAVFDDCPVNNQALTDAGHLTFLHPPKQ